MGNIKVSTPRNNNNSNNPNTENEEDSSKKILQEIQRYNFPMNDQSSSLKEYFSSFIMDEYQRPISHFKETYKIKKNYPVRGDLLYKIYVIQNKNTKHLFNLKIYRFDIANYLDKGFDNLAHDIEKNMITNDLDALQTVKFPNCENLFDVYINTKKNFVYLMLVVSYTTPMTLLDVMNHKIAKHQKFSDLEFEQIMKFLLETLNFLKYYNLIHRGICPSYIYFQKENDFSSLTIKNFFFSIISTSGTAKGLTGTLLYSAPEVLKDLDQDYKIDMYSAGLILFQVLTLRNPYQSYTSKELLLEKIEGNIIQSEVQQLLKLGYNPLYLEKIMHMIHENKNVRYSIDDVISNREIKEIQMRLANRFLCDPSNLIFNMRIKTNFLENILNKLKQADSTILAHVYYIFSRNKNLLLNQTQLINLAILFNFLDINHNIRVSCDVITDRLNEWHLTLNPNLDTNVLKNYLELYKQIFDILLNNNYSKNFIGEGKQCDFDTFVVISLIVWFLDGKLGMLSLMNDLKNSQQNIKEENSEEKILRSSGNKSTAKKEIKILKKNSAQYTNSIADLGVFNPEFYYETNENKLTPIFNAYFNTKNYISFDKLIFDKFHYDVKQLSIIQKKLIEKSSKDGKPIIEQDLKGNKYYMSKQNFVQYLELEFA